jgi:Zn-dependent M28 family amino/carboxypeptidase
MPQEIVIVGAHYDTVYDCPGADDNTSGVAGLLEFARLLKTCRPARTVQFVAFVNEEPRYFQTEQMGALVLFQAGAPQG